MAFPSQLSFILLLLISTAVAQPSFRPTALVAPVRKDPATLQYVTRLHQRTPSVPVSAVLDLGGESLWVDCDAGYASSTYRPARCRSAQCSLAGSISCGDCFSAPRPGCNNDTCGTFPDNSVTRTATSGELASDALSIQSTDGSNPGRTVTVKQFLFTCAPTFLLQGLAAGVSGMAGLGRAKIGLPSQFAAAFSFRRKFAVCLSGSSSTDGVVFFGNGPYTFLPGREISSEALTYTPLLTNPVSTASAGSSPSTEYFISVQLIRVNDAITVALNSTLLAIDEETGFGGTKISTVNPYTVLESSIFKAVGETFTREAAKMNITRTESVAPFGFCYGTVGVASTRLGPAVPSIELVLRGEGAVWRMFGANSVVEAREGVLCLAMVDGGAAARTAMVIGGYQVEDNLLEFDLAASRLGFSSTLLGRQTTCANFNFTSNA